jgi:hypothetical protein
MGELVSAGQYHKHCEQITTSSNRPGRLLWERRLRHGEFEPRSPSRGTSARHLLPRSQQRCEFRAVCFALGVTAFDPSRQQVREREISALCKRTPTHRIAGLVLIRQSLSTVHNTTFMRLEDETGVVNVIVWASIAEKYWRPFLQAHSLPPLSLVQFQTAITNMR